MKKSIDANVYTRLTEGGKLKYECAPKNYTTVEPKQFVFSKSKLKLATSRAGRQMQRIARQRRTQQYRAGGHILRKN